MSQEIDYFADEEITPPEATLEKMLSLAEESKTLAAEIADEEIETEKKRNRMNDINRVFIPNIMSSLQMESFTFSDGSKITVEDKLQASIPVAKRNEAYDWLDNHGFGDLIKTQILTPFERDDKEGLERAVEILAAAGFPVQIERSVHASTLKSFVKERLAEAADVEAVEHDGFDDKEEKPNLPLDIFSVYQFKEAKIIAPKAKKQKKSD